MTNEMGTNETGAAGDEIGAHGLGRYWTSTGTTQPSRSESPVAAASIKNAFDGKRNSWWTTNDYDHVARERTAIFQVKAPPEKPDQARVRVRLRFESISPNHSFGRIRLSISDDVVGVFQIARLNLRSGNS